MIAQRDFVLVVVVVGVLAMAQAIACHDLKVEEDESGLEEDSLELVRAEKNETTCSPSSWRCSARIFLTKRLLHFTDFKSKFNKRYASSSEESLRHALYSERLLKVSMSVMRYFSRRADTYKSINSRSDMTKRERERLAASRPQRIGPPKDVVIEQLEEEEDDGQQIQQSTAQPDEEVLMNRKGSRKLRVRHKRMVPLVAPVASKNPQSGGFSWFAAFANTAKPAGVDLRKTDCLAPPGDQGKCESCASFVAIAQLEYLRCRETGKLEKFSEQFPVDCGGPFGMMGCVGADVHSVNKFISQVGLVLSSTYAYVGRRMRCPYYNRSSKRYNFESATTLKLKRGGIMGVNSKKWSKFLEQKIPLHVGVFTNDDFEDYGGGVANSWHCSGHQGAHGMLLIGEGREDGVDYWLLRNSYGDWGLEGNYKLNKRATSCFSDEEMGYYPAAFLKTFGSSFVWSYDQ